MSKARDAPQPKIGAGHADGMWRQGLSELRGAFFNESNVAQPPQVGLYGTPSQGEVAAARRSDEKEMADLQTHNEEPPSILTERLEQVEMARDAQVREPERDMEKE